MAGDPASPFRQLEQALARVREIAALPDDEALLEMDSFLDECAALRDLLPIGNESTDQGLVVQGRISELKNRIGDHAAAIGRGVVVRPWIVEEVIAAARALGRNMQGVARDELEPEIAALVAQAEELRAPALMLFARSTIEECIGRPPQNRPGQKHAAADLLEIERLVAEGLIERPSEELLLRAKSAVAAVQAYKKLSDARVAEAEGRMKTGIRLRAGAEAVFREDWAFFFGSDAIPSFEGLHQ